MRTHWLSASTHVSFGLQTCFMPDTGIVGLQLRSASLFKFYWSRARHPALTSKWLPLEVTQSDGALPHSF